jgi:hypothetical protein
MSLPDTREALAAMTDEEILAHYRNKHGDPHMTLSMAREMHRAEFKYLHLSARAEQRKAGFPCPRMTRPGRSESGRQSIGSLSTSSQMTDRNFVLRWAHLGLGRNPRHRQIIDEERRAFEAHVAEIQAEQEAKNATLAALATAHHDLL